jgi:CHASE2 domain-containing sensor protein
MSQLIVLKLGIGNWQQGLPSVIVQLWQTDLEQTDLEQTDRATPSLQWTGSLPAAPELAALYGQWRSLYQALSYRFNWRQAQSVPTQTASIQAVPIEIEEEGVTNVSEAAFDQVCQQLKRQLDRWLDSGSFGSSAGGSSFGKVERQLRTKLLPSQEIRVTVEAEDHQLRRFPWHLWSFFDDYPQAEMALSALAYGRVERLHRSDSRSEKLRQRDRARILAILGNSQGIDVHQDRVLLEQLVEQLPATEIVFLVEPQRQQLDQCLWDQQGWDMLFFAGHSLSQANGIAGEISINQTESLTIAQLKNALRAAIAQGLKLAIFNSCDGLGLAAALADLNLPQLVVMREPVPDLVAQAFLKYLLTAFTGGQSFYRSVREAREKLQGLEDQFPCASWLPVICQNPAETPIDWQALVGKTADPAHEARLDRADLSLSSEPSVSSILSRNISSPKKPPLKKLPPRSAGANWQRLNLGLLTGTLIAGLVMGLRFVGVLQPAELQAFDFLMRLRPSEGKVDSRILVVEVTESDTNQYGYPLADVTLAALIQKLEKLQPRVIGLDMHRYQPRGQGRSALMTQFNQHKNLFAVCSFGSTDRNYRPPPEFSNQQLTQQMGFSDLLIDGQTRGLLSDRSSGDRDRYDLTREAQLAQLGDTVRRQLLSYNPTLRLSASPCVTPYSLSFQLAFQFLAEKGVQPIQVNADQNWQFGAVALEKLPDRFGGYQSLTGHLSQILINYRTDPPAAQATLQQVLQEQVDRSLVENRIVLIGITAPVAKDSLNTPYGEMPGVWIHAHLVSQMLSAVLDRKPLLWGLPQWEKFQWGDLLWIWTWAAVGGALAWRFRSWLWLGVANCVAILALYQFCLVILIQGGWMPLIPPLLALGLTSGISQVLMTIDRRRQS